MLLEAEQYQECIERPGIDLHLNNQKCGFEVLTTLTTKSRREVWQKFMRGMLTYAPLLQPQNTDAGESYLQRLAASCFLYCHLMYVLLLMIYIFCNLLFTPSPRSHYIRIEIFALQSKSQTYFAGCFLFSRYRIQIYVATNARCVNHPRLYSCL